VKCLTIASLTVTSVLLVAGCGGGAKRAEQDPAPFAKARANAPNIVVVMTDDQAIDNHARDAADDTDL